MFTFFGLLNSKSSWNRYTQIYNLLVAGVVTYDMLTNPEAIESEHGLDIAIHLFQALILRENATNLEKLIGMLLNPVRLGAIYAAETIGCTGISHFIGRVDILNHLLNEGVLMGDVVEITPKLNAQ